MRGNLDSPTAGRHIVPTVIASLAAMAVVAVTGCSQPSSDDVAVGDHGKPSVPGSPDRDPLDRGEVRAETTDAARAAEPARDARSDVTLEVVTSEELERLASSPAAKLLLVNFWATWCLPCRTEFPDLVALHRQYSPQELEFVAVSVDSQKDRLAVISFLRDARSSARNLQTETDDLFALRRAFGRGWNAGVPFTVLLNPSGEVVFRQEGPVLVRNLRRAIQLELEAGAEADATVRNDRSARGETDAHT